ncbi:SpoIIE family protein phosphatase [Candidatus Peregrinibacteria bacterium]|nr:SpoIIE family protein phosphatase [Candidatus Peregrinibacteria bacterium]
MKISIRLKLVVAISLLVMVLFSTAAYMFVGEKKVELAHDIYRNALAFGRLTAAKIVADYDLYLAQNSFVYFNREIAEIFRQNDDIGVVRVVSYNGQLLYDSSRDGEQRYEGPVRMVTDEGVLSEVRSENISVLTQDGRIVFLKEDSYVDWNERDIEPLAEGEMLQHIVVPASDKYAIFYHLDYANLEERIDRVVERIIYLAVFGFLLGVGMSLVMSKRITKSVEQLVYGAERIATGDFKVRVDIKTRDEMKFLGDAFNKMAVDLEASVGAKLYQERVGRELELARQIQKQLVPEIVPKIEGLDIAAGLLPAEEIGGDIYDFIPLSDSKMLMYLGDVTGHGVPAGIVSSIANALLFGYCDDGDLKKVLIDVNRVLDAKTMPTMFMTLCLMKWDADCGKFSYANAGHEQILHFKTAEKKSVFLSSHGIALGMLPDISQKTGVDEVALKSGDFMVIYSDGIPEAWKNEKEKYGHEKLMELVNGLGGMPTAEAIKQAILADVKQYMGNFKQVDDITIMVIKKI